MQENLYQLIKDRRTPFPETTVRNILYQVSFVLLNKNLSMYLLNKKKTLRGKKYYFSIN